MLLVIDSHIIAFIEYREYLAASKSSIQAIPPMTHKDDIKTAVRLIKEGELVAMPTETVYGLAADACNEEACQKIYALKKRPSNNPLIVHVHDLESAKSLAHFNENALKLATLWPGPLTMVLPKKNLTQPARAIAACVTAGLNTIAIRIPAHDLAIEFIKQTGTPIAAPSANISGRISPSSKTHVRANFTEDELYVLGASEEGCKYGLESTIIDLTTDTPVLLRYGFITPELISEVLGKQVVIHNSLSMFESVSNSQEKSDCFKSDYLAPLEGSSELLAEIRAPGMAYKHYAPRTKIRINASYLSVHEIGLAFGENNFETQSQDGKKIQASTKDRIMNLSQSGDLARAASKLFDYLHILDELAIKNNYKTIAVAPIPNTGIGLAINDRLRRAAAGTSQA